MIYQRAAIPARPGFWRGWLTAQPATAGRQRLGEALRHSILVQLMLAMTFFATAALLYMAQASQVSVQQINIAVLKNERMQLIARNTAAQARATNLQSPARINTIATNQLDMTNPDLSSAIWINPVVPRVAPVISARGNLMAAQRASQPLAWMEHAIRIVRSSL